MPQLDVDLAQKGGAFLRERGVNEHTAAQLKTGRPAEPRNDRYIPVQVIVADFFNRGGANDQVVIGVTQAQEKSSVVDL